MFWASFSSHLTIPGCFASDSMINVKQDSRNGSNVHRKRLDQLVVGEYVESFDPEFNSITFSQVYFITHDKERKETFPLLKLVIGNEDNQEQSLRLHPKHLVYACQRTRSDQQLPVSCSRPSVTPITAESVQVGDMLWLRNSTSNTFSPTPVMSIEKTKSGIRHPMTVSHYIVVDNILASVHMYDEMLYRQVTSPIRFLYNVNPSITDTWVAKRLVEMWDLVENNIL